MEILLPGGLGYGMAVVDVVRMPLSFTTYYAAPVGDLSITILRIRCDGFTRYVCLDGSLGGSRSM